MNAQRNEISRLEAQLNQIGREIAKQRRELADERRIHQSLPARGGDLDPAEIDALEAMIAELESAHESKRAALAEAKASWDAAVEAMLAHHPS